MLKSLAIMISLLLTCPGLVTRPGIPGPENNASVRGKVFDTGFGIGIQGVTITYQGSVHRRSAVSDSDGSYSIEHLPEGHYTVTAQHLGFVPYQSEVTLGPGLGRVTIGIRLADVVDFRRGFGRFVEGIITGPGHDPLEGAELVVTSPFDKTFLERASTQRDGAYKIMIPRFGQYVVYVSKEGYTAVARSLVAGGERTTYDFTLPVFHL